VPQHAPVFDRFTAALDPGQDTVAVRVVVATTPNRDRALRVPAVGERAQRVLAATGAPSLDRQAGWLLLVDEGPGETWLYLGEQAEPADALAEFLRRRGRTDFARARRRSRMGGIGSVGVFAGLVVLVYGAALGLGVVGQALAALLLVGSLIALVRARPR
jgi:hypothetical protein